MQAGRTGFFDGIPESDVARVLSQLTELHFTAGDVVISEGDQPREMYVIRSGHADVLISDRTGGEMLVNRLGPQMVIGEMSLFTGQPASASVRATADLTVLVINEEQFQQIATRFPRIFRNIGATLSEKLARADRRGFTAGQNHVTLLADRGAPPLLGYGLACSIAWHVQAPVLLLVLGSNSGHPDLRAHVRHSARSGACENRADLLLVTPDDHLDADSLPRTLDDLGMRYRHVLVQYQADHPPALHARTVSLADADHRRPFTSDVMLRGWGTSSASEHPDRTGVLTVPPLTPQDEHYLADGLMPPYSPAGRALGWAARDVARLKVGLALGAGSSKGYGHVGVLRLLERVGVPVDYLSGTSIGGCVASMYAAGYPLGDLADHLDEVGASAFRLAVPTKGMLSSNRLRAAVRRLAGERRIEDLHIPLGLVAADIDTQQEVVFRRGLLWPALMATTGIPGVFPPQPIGPYTLVDGGVINPVPSNVVANMGADVVIGVKLARRVLPMPIEIESTEPSGKVPSMFQTVMASVEIMQSRIVAATAAAAAIQIDLDFSGVDQPGLRNFTQGRRFVTIGERAAEDALPRLAAVLPWLPRP